jgi:hypothetical protein
VLLPKRTDARDDPNMLIGIMLEQKRRAILEALPTNARGLVVQDLDAPATLDRRFGAERHLDGAGLLVDGGPADREGARQAAPFPRVGGPGELAATDQARLAALQLVLELRLLGGLELLELLGLGDLGGLGSLSGLELLGGGF